MSVTIAIACYNQGHFLADAIESALAQTRRPDEVIVVDDGSSDDTRDVAGRFPGVTYIWKANGGLGSARNAGLANAAGARILFLDADDTLLPDAVNDGLAALAAKPDAAFVHGGYREVDEFRNCLSEHVPQAQADVFESLLRGNYISMHGTVMYDTAILRSSGGFDVTLKSCEDYDVLLRLARSYPVACHSSIAAEYRRHGGNMTANNARMIRYSRLVLKRHGLHSGLPPRYRAACRAGMEFMTGYYADATITQAAALLKRGDWRDAMRSLTAAMRVDPRFALRVVRRLRRRAGKILGRQARGLTGNSTNSFRA